MAVILIVEDDVDVADSIKCCLEDEGHITRVVGTGRTALELYQQIKPDVIVLDLGLPDLNGLEVCEKIRENRPQHNPYILMLTAQGEVQDREHGLGIGADDYLGKPYSTKELTLRVNLLLGRERQIRQTEPQELIRSSRLCIDLKTREVQVRSRSGEWKTVSSLGSHGFDLLAKLAKTPNRVWSSEQLLDEFWPEMNYKSGKWTLDSCLYQIRTSLKEAGGLEEKCPFIKNVHQLGYKFKDEKV